MPSGDSLANRKPKAKTPLRRAIALLSPLLIISLGLHGLAMLLPLPEKEEIVEEEPELPEPIQVSELPELDLPNSEPAPTTAFVPTPEPESPSAVRPSAPAAPPPVVTVQQPQPAEPLKSSPVESQNVTPQTFGKDPLAKKEPIGSDLGNPAGLSLTTSVYSEERRGSADYFRTFTTNLGAGAYGNGTSISYKKLDNKELTLRLPAGGRCFPKEPRIDADNVVLTTSLGVVVIQSVEGNDGEGFVQDILLVSSTGYEDADNLIRDALTDNQETRNLVEDSIREQVANDGKFPFEPPSDTLAYNIFKVNVMFDGQQNCPEEKQ